MRRAVLVLAACGRINFGAGDDDNTDGGIPLQPARAISTGMSTSCAILDDGTLWCWGRLAARGISVPTQMDPSTDWIEVGSAYGHACARKPDGTLWCLDGQGSTKMSGPAAWTSLAMRDGGGCGINGGAIYCWGDNAFGTLGNPSASDTDTPVPATAAATFDVVAGSSKTMCAIDTAQHLWCWGQNSTGEVGVPSTGNVTAPTQIGTASWQAVASSSVSCGLQTDGTLWCWGGNFGTMTQLDARTDWTAIAVGVTSVCAIRDRELWCSGNNWFGQLGAGDTINRTMLTRIDPDHAFTAIAMTAFTTCAIRDGLAACTGLASSGELGDGAWRFAPGMRNVLGTGWVDVTLQDEATCGRKIDGSSWCWGHSSDGQLGFTGSASAPRRVGTATWMHIAATTNSVFAIAPDQTLWSWGPQYPVGFFSEPTLFDATPAWQRVSGGRSYACAIRSDGLWCWGANGRSAGPWRHDRRTDTNARRHRELSRHRVQRVRDDVRHSHR